MKLLFILILVIGVSIVIEFLKLFEKSKSKNEVIKFPYLKKFNLMTSAEHDFFKVLAQILDDRFYIIPQVHLSEIILVNKYEKYYKTYLSKIDKKSVDYVVFNKDSFAPLLVIELDDSSHNLEKRMERDKFVEQLLDHIKLPLLRYRNQSSYDSNKILNDIKDKLGYK